MTNAKQMKVREKILDAIRALPTDAAKRKWAERLGGQLYEMQLTEEQKKWRNTPTQSQLFDL